MPSLHNLSGINKATLPGPGSVDFVTVSTPNIILPRDSAVWQQSRHLPALHESAYNLESWRLWAS
jgi:hypothetical protein